MSRQIKFEGVVTAQDQTAIQDAVNKAASDLQGACPVVAGVQIQEMSASDTQARVGTRCRVAVKGSLGLQEGPVNLADIDRAGEAAFDTFKLKPLVVLDTTDKNSSAAGIVCTECRQRVGEVKDYVRRIATGREAEIRSEVEKVIANHLVERHPDLEPCDVLI